VDACCAINGRGNIAAPIAAMHFRREVFFAIRSTGAEKMAEGVSANHGKNRNFFNAFSIFAAVVP
jgi:hypothetical protein